MPERKAPQRDPHREALTPLTNWGLEAFFYFRAPLPTPPLDKLQYPMVNDAQSKKVCLAEKAARRAKRRAERGVKEL